MPNAELAFGVLSTELWSRDGAQLAWKALRRLGPRGLVEFTGNVLVSCRDWAGETFDDERVHGLFAPWVLHTGLGPDAASSGFMAQVIGVAIELGGMPVPRGGGVKLVEALAGDRPRQRRDVRDGARRRARRRLARVARPACGRRTAKRSTRTRAVLANVTPQQLYGELLGAQGQVAARGAALPVRPRRDADPLRAVRAAAVAWRRAARPHRDRSPDARPRRRLAGGQRGRARPAPSRGDRRRRPADGGRPVARARGRWILWIQLQEVPSRPKGDAAGELDTGDGTWTEELRERYADRIQARIAAHAPNLESAILGRVVFSPADIAAANPNMPGGDIYSGSCALDQNLLWRPRPGLPGHRTPRRRPLAHRREHASRALGSAPAPARSSRRSCCVRASPSGSAY